MRESTHSSGYRADKRRPAIYQAVQLDIDEGVAVLTLNLPAKRNAMTPELTRDFRDAVEEVRGRQDVRVLVLTGAGSAFCAGGDLAMLERMMGQAPEQNRREMGEFYRSYLSLLHIEAPVIAALNGTAIGAGACLALACDLRIAAESARLGFTFLNLGLHPGMGATHLLPQIVGPAHAADLIFTGRIVSAAEALTMGLVNKVVPPDKLMTETRSVAREIAGKSPNSVRAAKRALARPKIEGL